MVFFVRPQPPSSPPFTNAHLEPTHKKNKSEYCPGVAAGLNATMIRCFKTDKDEHEEYMTSNDLRRYNWTFFKDADAEQDDRIPYM